MLDSVRRVLICGDRNWSKVGLIRRFVYSLHRDCVVVEGEARGADRIAAFQAKVRCLNVEQFPADWQKHGRAAGPIRNRQMLDTKPDLVAAFHENIESSKGTRDCVEEAKRRNITVVVCDGARWTWFPSIIDSAGQRLSPRERHALELPGMERSSG